MLGLGKPLPVERRRDEGVTRGKVVFDLWWEISPFGYFSWRWRHLRSRFSRRSG